MTVLYCIVYQTPTPLDRAKDICGFICPTAVDQPHRNGIGLTQAVFDIAIALYDDMRSNTNHPHHNNCNL